jgi:serine/threonine protein phosphatase 1
LLTKRLFGRFWREKPVQHDMPTINPDMPLAVIGDIHGRADLLGKLLQRVPEDHQIICVGDYIDRGEQSAQALELLKARDDILCLLGNHEDMLLKFLDDPERNGERWLRYGGLQTLQSFGVSVDHGKSAASRFLDCRDALLDAMGADMVDWIRHLPLHHVSGNVAVVHAAADPARPVSDQDHSVLCWGHPEFPTHPRQDGIWVVHGHTIVDNAHEAQGRIAVDTGGYATGRLTAALISTGSIDFIST